MDAKTPKPKLTKPKTPKPKLTKFLPSYVGSKACWVEKLERYRGRDFVEFFAGSAVLSANLANQAVLNDTDPFLYRYFQEYETQPLVETFTDKDYFAKRKSESWYRWLYYLQRMSFSGVYRHSRNGYNVPIKSDYKPDGHVCVKDELERSIARFKELDPTLHNLDYAEVPLPEKLDIAILDPPYETKKAAYNVAPFDYGRYWDFARWCVGSFKVVIVFDWDENVDKHLPGRSYETRNMRVNGKYKGAKEAMCVIDNEDGP